MTPIWVLCVNEKRVIGTRGGGGGEGGGGSEIGSTIFLRRMECLFASTTISEWRFQGSYPASKPATEECRALRGQCIPPLNLYPAGRKITLE